MLDKALDPDYFETPNEAFIRKMRSENTLGMFIAWSERGSKFMDKKCHMNSTRNNIRTQHFLV